MSNTITSPPSTSQELPAGNASVLALATMGLSGNKYMKTQKIYNDKNLENTINSIIEDSMDFLADDISSILILIELDSKENGIDLAKVIRSNSAISSKLDLVLEEFYTSLCKEIKVIFGIEITKTSLKRKKHNKKVT